MLLNIGLQVGSLGGSPPPPIMFTGTVRQSDTTPVQDAVVTVISPLDQHIITKGVTDKGGRYNIPIDYGNQLLFFVSKPGFVVNATTLILQGRETIEKRTLDFMITPLRLP